MENFGYRSIILLDRQSLDDRISMAVRAKYRRIEALDLRDNESAASLDSAMTRGVCGHLNGRWHHGT